MHQTLHPYTISHRSDTLHPPLPNQQTKAHLQNAKNMTHSYQPKEKISTLLVQMSVMLTQMY